MKFFKFCIVIAALFFFSTCKNYNPTLFKLLPSSKTNINFENRIDDKGDLNFTNYAYIYNGGGVAAGDINNDGLTDVIFTGNQVEDLLYLNEGNFHFEDITAKSGIQQRGGWKTGVTMADINGDSFLDIYICRAGLDSANRDNLLYINNGDLTFSEKAKDYGLNNNSLSIHANFFDYDNDGDLDVYLLNHPDDFENQTNFYFYSNSRNFKNGADKLFRNDGNVFTDVSEEAGIIKNFGYGLSVSASDVNGDGWTDLFIANDFFSTDLLYINNRNGTFSEKSKEYFTKTTLFSMGSDFGDINNDGLMELMVVDMKPQDHLRLKKNHLSIPQEAYSMLHQAMPPNQYISNTLHFANSNGGYSEISELAGVARTDWSWAVLLQDFDNDGWNDMYITNGTKRDLHDLDFMMMMDDPTTGRKFRNRKEDLIEKMPSTLLPNYIYKNNGDLSFADKNAEWGFTQTASSSGAVYADLDNDGDLDLIVSNTDIPPFVYENKTNEMLKKNFLRVKLRGNNKNTFGINSKVAVHYGNHFQVKELSTVRGYQSTPEPITHFGLDTILILDSVVVNWLGGGRQALYDVAVNQVLDMHQEQSQNFQVVKDSVSPIFVSAPLKGLDFKHQESNFNDFKRDKLLHCMLSKEGPGIAVGDANADGRDDAFIGGAAGTSGKLYLQHADGSFSVSANQPWESQTGFEDMGVLFADLNNDGLQDLYITSGSNEFAGDSTFLRNRVFINTGKGNFVEKPELIPAIYSSSSCVIASDFDKDGDLDLLIGGRMIPGQYPLTPSSVLLKNEGGIFKDVTDEIAGLRKCGMVTSAIWSDYNNDGWTDLILAGEWMPVTFFKNENGKLENTTAGASPMNSNGWWKSINGGDFDNDGDIDYILGNNGLNSLFKATPKEPVEIYANDFDSNGSLDPVLFHYLNGKQGQFADRNLFCEKMPEYNNRFFTFTSYANTSKEKLFTEEQLKTTQVFKAETLASGYLENKGNGSFDFFPLPNEAQLAPVYGSLIEDFDDDGYLDVLLTGNSYSCHYSLGDADALRGLLLKGNGNGKFLPISLTEAGIFNNHDGKSLAMIYLPVNNSAAVLFGNNNDSLDVYSWNNKESQPILIKPDEISAEIFYKNGSKRKVEFYNGAGYLSQSSKVLFAGSNVEKAEIFTNSSSRIITDQDMLAAGKGNKK